MNHGGGPVILVNGRAKEAVDVMHYDQAVRAAGFDPGRGVLYSVTYRWNGPRPGDVSRTGELVPGGVGVETVEGMIFDVTPVGSS